MTIVLLPTSGEGLSEGQIKRVEKEFRPKANDISKNEDRPAVEENIFGSEDVMLSLRDRRRFNRRSRGRRWIGHLILIHVIVVEMIS